MKHEPFILQGVTEEDCCIVCLITAISLLYLLLIDSNVELNLHCSSPLAPSMVTHCQFGEAQKLKNLG